MLNYLRQFIIKIKQLLWKLIFALKTIKADEWLKTQFLGEPTVNKSHLIPNLINALSLLATQPGREPRRMRVCRNVFASECDERSNLIRIKYVKIAARHARLCRNSFLCHFGYIYR